MDTYRPRCPTFPRVFNIIGDRGRERQQTTQPPYRKPATPVIDAVCSSAFRLNEAILLPRQLSPTSCMLHAIWPVGEEVVAARPLVRGESHEEDTPYGVEYIPGAPLGGGDTPLLSPVIEPGCRPLIVTGVCRDWPRPWRGIDGGRLRGLVPIVWGIWDMPVQRVSDGNVQNESFMFMFMFMPPNDPRHVEGRRAPGVRNTLVVFFLFFHLARRF